MRKLSLVMGLLLAAIVLGIAGNHAEAEGCYTAQEAQDLADQWVAADSACLPTGTPPTSIGYGACTADHGMAIDADNACHIECNKKPDGPSIAACKVNECDPAISKANTDYDACIAATDRDCRVLADKTVPGSPWTPICPDSIPQNPDPSNPIYQPPSSTPEVDTDQT
jgi:hypothetical protein